MFKIKNIIALLALLMPSGCALDYAARMHLPTISQAGHFPYGGWVIAEYHMAAADSLLTTVSGELLAYHEDQLFILDSLQMVVIPAGSLHNATLYFYKTQPMLFATMGLIFMMPNIIAAIAMPEYAGGFMALAIVPFVMGTVFTAREATTKKNRLIYPEPDSLYNFTKFSRFPQGMPEGIAIEDLIGKD
jgi:hypothetical protein